MKRVLVLGGGIGGVESAIALSFKGFDVQLISDRDFFYIYPISIWIPTGEYSFEDVSVPLEEIAQRNRFRFVKDKVSKILTKERRVFFESGAERSYDYLVIAIGGSKVKHRGIENTFSICGNPEDALKLREEIEKLVKRGDGKIAVGFGGNPQDPSGVRGGPAFEFAFNLHVYLRKLGLRKNFEITFFAPMPKPGIRLGEKNAEKAYKMLDKLGIKKHFGKRIKEFQKDGIVFEDGSKLKSDLTMFIPASTGHEVFKNSDLPLNEAGFVKINPTCEVVGTNETVWAIGDSAAIDGPSWKAKQGHLAEVMGRIVARNIYYKEKGFNKREEYLSHLSIVCLMDMGTMGGALVYRDDKRSVMLPLPVIGHHIKKLWGWYFKNSKLRKIPRIPGFDRP
ncbi:MAG: FAD-dependent oxidoreductase [Desulfurobacteriaceae bacterium]